MVMNENNNRYLLYLFNKRSSQALCSHLYKNRNHPSVEGNKICKLMIRQSEKRRQSVHLIIFICRCRAAFSHTAFRLSIITVVYVSSNYLFIILMPNVSAHTGVGWGKKKTNTQHKRKGERHTNASVKCNSELAFIHRDHWPCVGKGVSRQLDSVCVAVGVGLCSPVVSIYAHYRKTVTRY